MIIEKVVREKESFRPFSITLKIESEAELHDLCARMVLSVHNVNSSLPPNHEFKSSVLDYQVEFWRFLNRIAHNGFEGED